MLLKDRLRQLFIAYDPELQRVIAKVLTLEQEHISFDRPRLKDEIDEIITSVATKSPGKEKNTSTE